VQLNKIRGFELGSLEKKTKQKKKEKRKKEKKTKTEARGTLKLENITSQLENELP